MRFTATFSNGQEYIFDVHEPKDDSVGSAYKVRQARKTRQTARTVAQKVAIDRGETLIDLR